jgi:hypothetical protein
MMCVFVCVDVDVLWMKARMCVYVWMRTGVCECMWGLNEGLWGKEDWMFKNEECRGLRKVGVIRVKNYGTRQENKKGKGD